MKIQITQDSPVCLIIGAENSKDAFHLGILALRLSSMKKSQKILDVNSNLVLLLINLRGVEDFPRDIEYILKEYNK